ncbi:MAG: hypothetical protein JWP91_3399 [Fibrobacteres bacterium]|nr:hypothetical protein [Fibrobacterota bacterium]
MPQPSIRILSFAAIASAFGQILAAAPVPSGALHGAGPAAPPVPFAVVELFTSEGCSSCPPADELLSRLGAEAERTGKSVFTLSFHVDYWNGLGWADPFSRSGFTDRQRLYARDGEGRIYTPQMIVNGTDGFVGSQGGLARKRIEAALERPAGAVISLSSVLVAGNAGDSGAAILDLTYRVTGHQAGDLLNLAVVEKGLAVPVKRGENRGRTLKHDNVVRGFRTERLDAEGRGRSRLALPQGMRAENALIIAYAQKPESLRTIGAARAAFPGSAALRERSAAPGERSAAPGKAGVR